MIILEYYYKRPVLFDFLIGILINSVLWLLSYKNIFQFPPTQNYVSMTSDIASIGFTSAGFILTLITLLITFKSGNHSKEEELSDVSTTFEHFFSSRLYKETIIILKDCIKSLVIVAVIGFGLKLFLLEKFQYFLFYFCVFGIMILILTLWRCLWILGKILEFQEQ